MLIIGRNPVLEALRGAGRVSKLYLRFGVHGESVMELQRLARERRIPSVVLPKQKFDRLGNVLHSQGIAALVEDAQLYELDELLALTVEQDPPFLAALDSIKDPHNLGAIMRTAVCAGAHGIVLPQRDSAMINETVVKASAGGAGLLPAARVASLPQALDVIKDHGIWIIGLAGDGETDLFSFDGARPVCVVVGSERGMRPIVRRRCDDVIRIPMWGAVDSLNASVAAALMFYEIRRRRL